MDVLCTFKIKIEISDYIEIKVKISNPSKEPPVPTKSLNQDLKDMDILCTFKIKKESKITYA